MIYLILYALKLPDGKTLGGFYYDWAQTAADAEKIFNQIFLNTECCRKEIWKVDNKGYRRLVKTEEYNYAQLPC